MSLTITNELNETVTFSQPTTGFHRIAGAYYLNEGEIAEEQYGIELHKAPGVDGYKVSRHGFDHRVIGPIPVVYVASTRGEIMSAYHADHDMICDRPLTVTPPYDVAYPACNLASFPKTLPKATGHETYMMRTSITFRQVRWS